MIELTLERVETAIENLSRVPAEQLSIKEQIYLKSLQLNREQMLKKPVAWAERFNEHNRRTHGFTDLWCAMEGNLDDTQPAPESTIREYKPLYDK